MSQNCDLSLWEKVYSPFVGLGRIASDFFEGLWPLPASFLIFPSVVGFAKNDFRYAKEQRGKNPLSPEEIGSYLGDYFAHKPIRRVGALISGSSIGLNIEEIYHFVNEHPSLLGVPVVTNLLSAGYERYLRDKNKGLEENIPED